MKYEGRLVVSVDLLLQYVGFNLTKRKRDNGLCTMIVYSLRVRVNALSAAIKHDMKP